MGVGAGAGPVGASYLGDRRWNDRWPDISAERSPPVSPSGIGAQGVGCGASRRALSRRPHSYDVFKHQHEMTVEGFQHRYHLIRTTTTDGVQNTEQIVDALRFETIKDYEDWLRGSTAFPTYVDQNIALMREGVKTNVLLPKVIVERVRGQVAELAIQPADKSGFYRPFRTIPDAIAAAERDKLTKAGSGACPRRSVQPSFARLLEFLDREYLPASYDAGGLVANQAEVTKDIGTSFDSTRPPI